MNFMQSLTIHMGLLSSSSDIKSGLSQAKENMMDILQFGINYILIPVAAAIILGFLIFFIVGAAKKHKMGEEYQDDVFKILIAVVILALVVSFPTWGWTMIGVNASISGEATVQQVSNTDTAVQ